jgi:hypothetical protein
MSGFCKVESPMSQAQQAKNLQGVGAAQKIDIRVGAPSTAVASVAIRRIDGPCRSIEESAIRYFEEHGFYAKSAITGSDIIVALGSHKNASTPSAKPLSLNRVSIHKYTLPRHLSPLKAYDFRLEGNLRLLKVTDESCDASLSPDFSAFEWVWALAVIDDGIQSKLISNGTLERLYIDPISDPFRRAKP